MNSAKNLYEEKNLKFSFVVSNLLTKQPTVSPYEKVLVLATCSRGETRKEKREKNHKCLEKKMSERKISSHQTNKESKETFVNELNGSIAI